MHRRSAAAEDLERRHRRRHRQAADRLRLPCADHELSGAGHADDRADRIRIEGRARPLLRRHDRDPARDRRDRSRAAGRSRPRRCATRRTPCTTSPTTRGSAPIAAPRAASRPAPRASTNTGARSDASTTSMATAIWCARARRSRTTRRRRSDGDSVIPGRSRKRSNPESRLTTSGFRVRASRARNDAKYFSVAQATNQNSSFKLQALLKSRNSKSAVRPKCRHVGAHPKTKTGAGDVGNSTSSAPAHVEPQVERTQSSGKSHSSAGSSPSASRSGEPARICSAIRPEFWRIAASILAVMSGLALRNAFEFSRPWPSRWLS